MREANGFPARGITSRPEPAANDAARKRPGEVGHLSASRLRVFLREPGSLGNARRPPPQVRKTDIRQRSAERSRMFSRKRTAPARGARPMKRNGGGSAGREPPAYKATVDWSAPVLHRVIRLLLGDDPPDPPDWFNEAFLVLLPVLKWSAESLKEHNQSEGGFPTY